MRYHKKVYFPTEYQQQLTDITNLINKLDWRYTSHCLDNIKNRAYNLKQILEFIKNLILMPEHIFEFYTDIGFINKICYRIPYNAGIDLILVVGEGKKLITIYYNSSDDEHYTLRKEQYARG